MNLLETLDWCDTHSIELTLYDAGTTARLDVLDPANHITPPVLDELRQHHDMLVAIVLGRRVSGHVPGVCSACGEVSIVAALSPNGKTRAVWPTCRFTPGCQGRHVPRDTDLERTVRRPPPPQAKAPAKATKSRLLGPAQPFPTDGSQ